MEKHKILRSSAKNLLGRVKALVLLGRDAKEIEKAARAAGFSNIYHENDMNDCVKRAHKTL